MSDPGQFGSTLGLALGFRGDACEEGVNVGPKGSPGARSGSGSLSISSPRREAKSWSCCQCVRVWAMAAAFMVVGRFDEGGPGGEFGLEPSQGRLRRLSRSASEMWDPSIPS